METTTDTTTEARAALAAWRAAGFPEDGAAADRYCAAAEALAAERRAAADRRWTRTLAGMLQKGIVLE